MAKKKIDMLTDSPLKKTEGAQPKPAAKPGKINPLGVVLEKAEIDQLDKAAQELGVSRHSVLQYAVKQFLADWKKGKRPELGVKTPELKVK